VDVSRGDGSFVAVAGSVLLGGVELGSPILSPPLPSNRNHRPTPPPKRASPRANRAKGQSCARRRGEPFLSGGVQFHVSLWESRRPGKRSLKGDYHAGNATPRFPEHDVRRTPLPSSAGRVSALISAYSDQPGARALAPLGGPGQSRQGQDSCVRGHRRASKRSCGWPDRQPATWA
jgi:hypothetical protein